MQYKLIPYNISDLKAMPSAMNSAVAAIAHEIELDVASKSIRKDLSDQFETVFEEHGWEMDSNLYFEPGRRGTLHYLKERILVQASWRHYNMIGTELLKFQTDYETKRIDAGVYICITDDLAKRVGEIFKSSGEKSPFEGSITMERASQYLRCVSKIITIPLAIMGLTYS